MAKRRGKKEEDKEVGSDGEIGIVEEVSKEESSGEVEDKKEEKEDDIISNDKIKVSDFIRKERISSWVAKVFIKTLNKDEYTETELKKRYKEFVEEGKKEVGKKGVRK